MTMPARQPVSEPVAPAAQRPAPGTAPLNAMSVDVEDYFQVQAFAHRVDRANWDSFPSRVEANVDRILALFEMKASTSVDKDDFRHLDWFLKEGPGKTHHGAAFVIYLGDQVLSFGPGRFALPLSILWSFPRSAAK